MPSSMFSECLIVVGHLSSAVFDVLIDYSILGYLFHLSPGLFIEDSILLLSEFDLS